MVKFETIRITREVDFCRMFTEKHTQRYFFELRADVNTDMRIFSSVFGSPEEAFKAYIDNTLRWRPFLASVFVDHLDQAIESLALELAAKLEEGGLAAIDTDQVTNKTMELTIDTLLA